MPNRRDFFKRVAGATAGMFVTGRGLAVGARREVFVGGRRIKVIDVHGHFVAREELNVVDGTNFAGSLRNQLNGPLVLGPDRLRILDEQGIDVQALSHQGNWWYAADRDLARRIIKVQNETLAAWCAAHPDRFVGLASVALQHPDLAAEQLEEAVKRSGLRGVGIAGSIPGEELSSHKFDPFWAKAEELRALVFVHPGSADGIVQNGGLRGKGDLGNIIGNPLETTVFLSHMIFEGTLDRFPGLTICGAHAGGYLPSYLGRSDAACVVRPNANCANSRRPSEYFKTQIVVDSLIFGEEGLRHLVAEIGARQIVYGTDIPFDWPVGVDVILRAPFLSDAEREAILGGNLIRLLRIAP